MLFNSEFDHTMTMVKERKIKCALDRDHFTKLGAFFVLHGAHFTHNVPTYTKIKIVKYQFM